MNHESRRFTKEVSERFLKRLKGTEGNIELAARSLGFHPETVRKWRRESPEFREQCKAIKTAAKT